jgi:hypothetical protein
MYICRRRASRGSGAAGRGVLPQHSGRRGLPHMAVRVPGQAGLCQDQVPGVAGLHQNESVRQGSQRDMSDICIMSGIFV